MKSIAIITHDMFGGGCERVIAELSNWFVSNSIKCTIVTEHQAPCFYSLRKEVELISLTTKSHFEEKDIFKTYIRLRKLMIDMKPDIILSMPEKVNVWVVLAMIGTGIPVVVSERNNPALYPKSKIKRILRKVIYPILSGGYIFQTKDASEFFSVAIQRRAVILPNPLDLKRIPVIEKGLRRKEIVAIGRLEKQKNFHLLIDAFSEFQKSHCDYVLTIYGDGSLKTELETYAQSVLIGKSYHFPGRKSDVLLQIADVAMFVLSSDYEGMPNALIEAMAMGLPVIATDCPSGGPKALIVNRDNGLLVPVGDKQALTVAMCRLADDKEYAEKMGRNALAIREKLEINKIASEWLRYLESVRNSKSKMKKKY